MATFTFEASLGYTRPRLQRSEKEMTTEKHIERRTQEDAYGRQPLRARERTWNSVKNLILSSDPHAVRKENSVVVCSKSP